MWNRGSILGCAVLDLAGKQVGFVEDTFPLDGSAPEFAVARVGRFGRRVFVPLERAEALGEELRLPFSRIDIEDAPSLDDLRWLDVAASRSRGYWSLLGDESVARLPVLPL